MAEEAFAVDSLQLLPVEPLAPEGDDRGTESAPAGKKTSSKTTAAVKAVTVAGQLPFVRKNAGGAVKMDSKTTGRRMSGSSGDPLDSFDGDDMDGILKSLISTKKMDSAYQRMGRRLLSLENYVEVLRGGEGQEAFITRKEFIEYLRKSQEDVEAQIQAEHDARIAAEEARRLEEEAKDQEEDPFFEEVRETLKAQEQTNECNLKRAMNDARVADAQKWTKVMLLEDEIKNLRGCLGEETKKRQSSEALFEKSIKTIQKSIKDLEVRMQSFAVNEAQKMIGALLFTSGGGSKASPSWAPMSVTSTVDAVSSERPPTRLSTPTSPGPAPSPSMIPTLQEEAPDLMEQLLDRRQKAFAAAQRGVAGSCGGPDEWRSAMLTLVDAGLIQPVRDQIQQLHKDLIRQRDTFEKKNRAREKEIQETTKHGQKTAMILREEAELRKQEGFETSISFQKVYKAILDSNEKISDDIQSAMDRIRGVQIMIDGHTKQIDGHTKAILECATREEAAKLSDAIGECVGKERFDEQMSEVKVMVLQQSERIGSIDLQVTTLVKNASASPTSSSRRGNLKRATRLKTLTRDASSRSMVASTAPGQDSIPSFFAGNEEGGDDDDASDMRELSRSRSGASTKVSLPGRDFAEAEGDQDEGDDEFYEESAYSGDSVEEQMRQQVGGICMGLVALAHHVLRGPPLVGLSRQNRLLNEKELLEELMNLRHWVTHGQAPLDWSLDRLTTVALRYSHPNPNEVHGPQPEMTTILQAASRDSSVERGRVYPLDTSVGSIGIVGTLGSSAGGGAGILGGPFDDATAPPSPAEKLPMLEGSRVAQAATYGPGGWRSHQPMSARELRTTLPPVG